ncbi:hypothetical protein [Rhodococcus sp. NJ-530]|uniref:hypothetical protein n=1 Tax=Rhodococcus sp. NJ-530 TaxID=2490853 RepID=UPI001F14F4C6|nr:hypothetical protein [Rhodococcus sp. NJ-530]
MGSTFQWDSLDFENMPEEFQAWLDETASRFRDEFAALDIAIWHEYEQAKEMSDKELGLSPNFKYKGSVFMLRNNKDIGPSIWKLIKPRKEVIHAKTIDA